ncbi:MAG: hypothetical protein HYT16_00470 [DPANN group archaeon]|nr:hypothetical protein [DPANN group archaeon]
MPETLKVDRQEELQQKLNTLKQILKPEDLPAGFSLLGSFGLDSAIDAIEIVRDGMEDNSPIKKIVADIYQKGSVAIRRAPSDRSETLLVPVHRLAFTPKGRLIGVEACIHEYDADPAMQKKLFGTPLEYSATQIELHPYIFVRKGTGKTPPDKPSRPLEVIGEIDILTHRRCTLGNNIKQSESGVELSVELGLNEFDPLYAFDTAGTWQIGFKPIGVSGLYQLAWAGSPSGFPDNTSSHYGRQKDGSFKIVTGVDLCGSSEETRPWELIKDFPVFQTVVRERKYIAPKNK